MSNVTVVIGPGQIGQAIARRVGVGKHVLLADMRQRLPCLSPCVVARIEYPARFVSRDPPRIVERMGEGDRFTYRLMPLPADDADS